MTVVPPHPSEPAPEVLVVIPAPLHTEALSRKVLRRLAGEPILARLIRIARQVVPVDHVVVLTDDDEVALLAERHECRSLILPSTEHHDTLSEPENIERALDLFGEEERLLDWVLVLYPTAPLVEASDLREAFDLARNGGGGADSVVSACLNSRRNWLKLNGSFVCDTQRQENKQRFREVQSFTLTRPELIREGRIIGDTVELAVLPLERAWEIRSPHDWWSFERLLGRRRVVFVVVGHSVVGLGHVYRSIMLAHELVQHDVVFVIPRGSDLAAEQIALHRFPVVRQGERSLVETVLSQRPDLVINDVLDTEAAYVGALQGSGARVINFEDLGEGAMEADLVINAIYDEDEALSHHLVGPSYFLIRDEFLFPEPNHFHDEVSEILVTFGGTDPSDMTGRVIQQLLPITMERGIRVSVVTGPGYLHGARLQDTLADVPRELCEVAMGTKRISAYMGQADLAFSSAGRTVFELSAMRLPSIIIAANPREEQHTFARESNGMRYLGYNGSVSDEEIREAFLELVDQPEKRRSLYDKTGQWDFRGSRDRILGAIHSVLEAEVADSGA